MPNTELPIDLENQVILMKKYVNFRQRKKMRDFLEYAGYFRASRYGKYLLTQVNALGSKADSKIFFRLYDFDVQLRLLLFKYCKKAEVYFKSAIANAVSLKTGNAGFYLDKQYYTIVMLYSYLRGDLRKEVLEYAYTGKNYKKEVTKQMDTWLDAVRNLRNYCAHHSMLIGMTSSVVIPDNRDSAYVLSNNTNLYSRLYALKKILPQKDADMLAKELDKLISKTKVDIYKMNILPSNWKDLYERVCSL